MASEDARALLDIWLRDNMGLSWVERTSCEQSAYTKVMQSLTSGTLRRLSCCHLNELAKRYPVGMGR